ncbi:hypothetical protein FO519_002444 [Halicephalobus sp. NKZ332]|nr:hypothetical protein FO519_002444 [Halicephalobus sp. NKZ332]
MDYSSSSRYSHSRWNRDDRRRRRSRSRSRSRSPRYYSSSFRHGKKTSKELEIENDVLTGEVKELRSQVNQITAQLSQLNANLAAVSLARVQAESRAAHFESEVSRINTCYQQCTDALRNLKTEFENVVKERGKWIEESEKLRKERDIAEKSAENFRDQLNVISERNTSLVKKCEQLSAENKDYKEKQAKYDIELRELRPALANFEQELEKTQKELSRNPLNSPESDGNLIANIYEIQEILFETLS